MSTKTTHRTGSATSGDVELFYRRFGHPGEIPVLILHGDNYYDSYDWIEVASAISEDRAVVAFVAKRIELTLRSAAPTHILNRNVITLASKRHRMRIHNSRSNIAPVRLAHQQRGPWSLARRIVMIGDKRGSIAEAALHTALQPNPVPTINQSIIERHLQAPCLGSKLYIATRISAMRAAASFDHFSPFSGVAADGSPITPLGAMSLVSHAKFAEEPSAFSNSG